MALKTFNLDDEIYKKYSTHCKTNGISMSRKIENFIREELLKHSIEAEPKKEVLTPKVPEVLGNTQWPRPDKHPMHKYC